MISEIMPNMISAIEKTEVGLGSYSLSIQILILMAALSLLPAIILSVTSFTRVAIVLSLLRQALGTPQTPNNQILMGVSLFMTFFIMSPVLSTIYQESVHPYLEGKIQLKEALSKSQYPLRTFMLAQVRTQDLELFSNLSGSKKEQIVPENVGFPVLLPAFMISELKTAFEIGFIIFIPFLIIDFVVASVLISMGMMMLSPLVISLPFKIMLFVLVDGWGLIVGTLAESFVGS